MTRFIFFISRERSAGLIANDTAAFDTVTAGKCYDTQTAKSRDVLGTLAL